MGPRALEAEIDRLYQLPLDEFTPARNTLAKGAGGDAARVRALTKPPIAAWAVNQFYWRNTELWKTLLAAAENAQRVQRAVLAGKAGDVRAASKVHDEAVEKALRATLALLVDAGHPATDATKHAIGTTLRALPGDEAPGRLTSTLQPAGFGILSGVSIAPGAARPLTAVPARGPAGLARPSKPAVDVKALTRARQAAASAARALQDAENAARREEFEKVRTEREEARAIEAAAKATELRESAAQRAGAAQRALSKARDEAGSTAAALKALEKG